MSGADVIFDVSVVGADVPAAVMAALSARAEDMTDLMGAIGDALVRSTHVRMEREQAPDGTPWIKSRRAAETGGRTLYMAGHLSRSITFEAARDRVAVGTNLVYAAIHQYGGTIKPKTPGGKLRFPVPGGHAVVASVTIPDRRYLGLGVGDPEEILAQVEDAFRLAMAAAGGAP